MMYLESFFGLFAFLLCSTVQSSVVVETTLGSIRGSSLVSNSSRHVLSFRGVPYAEPPVGLLRFQDPVPVKPWTEVFDATKEGPKCIQYNTLLQVTFGSEDCLRLNIYSHHLKEDGVQLRPVMVWIHGGAFYMGSGGGKTDQYGPDYLLDHDIVLVTINYRLGPFGFLSTEDAEAPGNYGLLDQSMALRWIKDNIINFGGNPDSITIFGESAGGASVHLQMLSPHSQGLFHRVIAQSGTALCAWAVTGTVGKYTQMVAQHLKCPQSPSRDTLLCLRSKTAEEIAMSRKSYEVLDLFPLAFVPRIDIERKSPFLPKHPERLISEGSFNPVPFITGATRNEGGFFIACLLSRGGQGMSHLRRDPVKYLRYVLVKEFAENGEEITKSIMQRYLSADVDIGEQISALDQMMSDATIFSCTDKAVSLHRQFTSQPVYYYHYNHEGQFTIPVLLGVHNKDLGVCHADELFLLFRHHLLPRIETPDDVAVSKLLIDLWTSFATTGNPRSSVDWMPTNKEMAYLKLDAKPEIIRGDLPYHQRLRFWDDSTSTFAGRDEL